MFLAHAFTRAFSCAVLWLGRLKSLGLQTDLLNNLCSISGNSPAVLIFKGTMIS